jgi:hypothetical protein
MKTMIAGKWGELMSALRARNAGAGYEFIRYRRRSISSAIAYSPLNRLFSTIYNTERKALGSYWAYLKTASRWSFLNLLRRPKVTATSLDARMFGRFVYSFTLIDVGLINKSG